MKQSDHDFVISLEDNAFNSLEHGIEHFLVGTNKDLKFTVLHVFHAVELLLKARLAKAHPLLMLQRPEDGLERGHTVDYRVMLERLKQIGVDLTAEDKKTLEYLHSMRNKIEHFEVAAKRTDIEEYIARTVKLLDRFVAIELGTTLKKRISDEIYRAMERAVYSYEERLMRALPAKFKEQLEYQRLICEECWEEAVLVPDPESSDGTVHCYACDARFYHWTCDRCGTVILTTDPVQDRDVDICDACWEDIGSRE